MADKLVPAGGGPLALRLKDMGDGTHALVQTAAQSVASAVGDKLIAIGDGATKLRLRDMGDGTHAEVIFGA